MNYVEEPIVSLICKFLATGSPQWGIALTEYAVFKLFSYYLVPEWNPEAEAEQETGK